MGRRPSFQFYPADWLSNANLKRCTHEQQGIWINVMCLMHDSPTAYGVLPWPLKEIAQAANCRESLLVDLVRKGVMKGADPGETCPAFVFTPYHARKKGEPVTLIQPQPGPLWYSSRMVRDEYVRQLRGQGTRFGDEDDGQDDDAPKPSPNPSPKPSPKPPLGDGPSSSSSSSSVNPLLRSDSGLDQGCDSSGKVAKTKQKAKPKHAPGASLEEILEGGKGTRIWESYWKLVSTFGQAKNPAPKITAKMYANALQAGSTPERIQTLAQALRGATSDPKYMPGLRGWLEGGGHLTPDLPKSEGARASHSPAHRADIDAAYLQDLAKRRASAPSPAELTDEEMLEVWGRTS